ncbi:hypothetical protein ACWGNN_47235 [Streptomyces sp. NPDC055817]
MCVLLYGHGVHDPRSMITLASGVLHDLLHTARAHRLSPAS